MNVTAKGWHIEYYFPGPDMRYNGTFVKVSGTSVPNYIAAFHDNWAKYIQLKGRVPQGGQFETPGSCGMVIRVGGFRSGVCLQSYHMPIASEAELKRVVQSYQYAQTRASQIQQMLAAL